MAHEEGEARDLIGPGHSYDPERTDARRRRSDEAWQDRHDRRANRGLARRKELLKPAAGGGAGDDGGDPSAKGDTPQPSLIRKRPPRPERKVRAAETRTLKTNPFGTTDLLNRMASTNKAEALAAQRELCALLAAKDAAESGLLRVAAEAGVAALLVNRLNAAQAGDDEALPLLTALRDLSSGDAVCVMAVVRADGVLALLRRLRSPTPAVSACAAATIANIAAESAECRTLCLQAGVMQPLLEGSQPSAPPDVVASVSKALAALCIGPVPFDWIAPALPTLAMLLFSDSATVMSHTATAFANITADPKNVAPVVECGASRRLVELMMHTSREVIMPCLQTVSNVCAVDGYCDLMLHMSFLPVAVSLLFSPSKNVREEALLAVSHLAARPKLHKDLADACLFTHVVQLAPRESGAVWALRNALLVAPDDVMRYLRDQCAATALCKALNARGASADVLLAALHGLSALARFAKKESPAAHRAFVQEVEHCKGVHTIEELQRHESGEVFNAAVSLVELLAVEEGGKAGVKP